MNRKISLFLALLFLCTGCMTTVDSDVTRFHNASILNTSKSFFIEGNSNQKGSLEFLTYTNDVSQELILLGFKSSPSKLKADYLISINYGIDNGNEVITSAPILGQTGGGTTYHNASVNTYGTYGSSYGSASGTSYTAPTYGVVGSTTSSHTEYTRVLEINIVEAKNKASKVFEGIVRSKGTSSSFAAVSNCLIKAMFNEFPGENGGTNLISLSSDGCVK